MRRRLTTRSPANVAFHGDDLADESRLCVTRYHRCVGTGTRGGGGGGRDHGGGGSHRTRMWGNKNMPNESARFYGAAAAAAGGARPPYARFCGRSWPASGRRPRAEESMVHSAAQRARKAAPSASSNLSAVESMNMVQSKFAVSVLESGRSHRYSPRRNSDRSAM